MLQRDQVGLLIEQYQARQINRRQFLQRSVAGGMEGAPSVSTQELRLHLDEDIENLDPAINPGHTDTTVAANIFEGLVTYRPDKFEVVNELAEEFTPSQDGLRYEFKLKEGIPFHGGYGELTAEDVKFSYERIAGLTTPKLDSPYQSDWAALQVVETRGKYDGTIVLKEPFAPLMTTTLPEQAGQIVSKKAAEERHRPLPGQRGLRGDREDDPGLQLDRDERRAREPQGQERAAGHHPRHRRELHPRGRLRRPLDPRDGDHSAWDADRLLGGRSRLRTRCRDGEGLPGSGWCRRANNRDDRFLRRARHVDGRRDRPGQLERDRPRHRGGRSGGRRLRFG